MFQVIVSCLACHEDIINPDNNLWYSLEETFNGSLEIPGVEEMPYGTRLYLKRPLWVLMVVKPLDSPSNSSMLIININNLF